MDLKKSIAAVMCPFMLMSMTGCNNVTQDEAESTAAESIIAVTAQSEDTNGDEAVQPLYDDTLDYSEGATILSVKDGSIEINRRSREEEKDMAEDGWTILVYMCGANLESEKGQASADMEEVMSVPYNGKVRVAVQCGGAAEWKCGYSSDVITRAVNTENGFEVVEELPSASMGESEVLADFVRWGVESYPSANIGLVLWNHGGGSISGVCFDELYDDDSLSLREIDQALNSVYDIMTERFEFIGFDACLMGTFEMANILVPYAKYMFASEEKEPGGGWDYATVVEYLSENEDASADELGRVQCESYYQICTDNDEYIDSTFSIIDLSKIDRLVKEFDKTAKEIYESKKKNYIVRRMENSANFGGNTDRKGYTNMVDIKSVLKNVDGYAKNAGNTLEALDEVVIYNAAGPLHNSVGGLSMYYPLFIYDREELNVFSQICTSAYYLALVDNVAYASEGGSITEHDNSYITEDCENIWKCDYDFSYSWGAYECAIPVTDVYVGEDGYYTVKADSLDEMYLAASILYQCGDDCMLYLGSINDVNVDWESGIITDGFDGTWMALDGVIMSVSFVLYYDDVYYYSAPALVDDEAVQLCIEYNAAEGNMSIAGIWCLDENSEFDISDAVSPLNEGDVIVPIYSDGASADSEDAVYGCEIIYSESSVLAFDNLPPAEYIYAIKLYDYYGGSFCTDYVLIVIDDDGEIYFYNLDTNNQ